MTKRNLLFTSFLVLVMLSGCAQKVEKTELIDNTPESTTSAPKETPADGYDELGGLWEMEAFYYKNQFISIHEDELLEDLYDTTFLAFDEDGTCQYWHSFITDAEYRRYEPDGASASMFLLDVQGTYFLDLQDEKLVKQEATDSKPQKAKYLVTLLDENTLQFDTFDPISGNAAAASEPMLFVKSTKERPENSFDIPVDDSSPAHDLPTERPDASALTSNIEDGASTGERNALQTAKDYLSVMAFSYTGLIEQLEYEGYSHSEAVYGADNCGADWFEQAAKSAKQYLEFMSFSRSSLIEQLEYEGFTHEQAIYGAEMNGY